MAVRDGVAQLQTPELTSKEKSLSLSLRQCSKQLHPLPAAATERVSFIFENQPRTLQHLQRK